MTNDICWTPSQALQSQSNLRHYMAWLAEHKGLHFDDYQALWQWSTGEVAAFWESIWQYFEVKAYSPYTSVLASETMPGTEWFPGATLNYAEHLFRHKKAGSAAVVFKNESTERTVLWEELEQQVAAFSSYLRAQGIGPGDCVVGYLPNIPEAMAAFMAVCAVGAVWSCCSPDFGVDTVIERFEQIHPKLLIAVDGYRYNGKPFDRTAEVSAIREKLGLEAHTVLVPYLNEQAALPGATLWSHIVDAPAALPIVFTPVPFDHPIWVLYSSGTTGKPKAITHSHGGVLLEHLKYLAFHNDAKPGEHFFWFSTTGWMMWNFLQASLLVGAVPVLYDGSPGYPSMDALWQWAADLPIHHFGTSAPFLTACMKQGLRPGHTFALGALRSIGSTGSPLPPEAYDWVYEAVGQPIWLASMSGGTDVCSAFVGGNPLLPVRRGHIQCRCLGCAMYAYSEDGHQLDDELGEMLIEKPMPSMPVFFWNDPDGQRYFNSYFADYPGKWRHGDWIRIFPDGSLIIQGRSDATLNRKGVRIGTAEIYRVLDHITGVKDALVLNLEQPDGSDVMVLFVAVDAAAQAPFDALCQTIKAELKSQCSPRHVPDVIHAVPDIPYTLSGKKMEVPVKKILMGIDKDKPLNRDAMRNPEAMDYFLNLDF